MNIYIKNTLRVLYYGWRDSRRLTDKGVNKSRISIYIDMIRCFKKYRLMSSQYLDNNFYMLSNTEKDDVGSMLKEQNKQRDHWEVVYNNNWRFLRKYSDFRWETTNRKRLLRTNAYIKYFGLGTGCWVQYGVMFICEHYSVGKLKVGNSVLFARQCDIDYTGDLTIGNGVKIMEGVKILTHAHDVFHSVSNSDLIPFSNRAYKTNLSIGNNVRIASQAIILPGVRDIGENSIISAGAVVNQRVPANVVVAGNPAKIVAKIPAVVAKRMNSNV